MWHLGTGGHGAAVASAALGSCGAAWAAGDSSSEDSVERRERGARGVLRSLPPSLSGPFGFCGWLQLHSRLQWLWKELLAEILGLGSGTRPCAIASYNIFIFHVQETGFSWESAWIMLILPGVALLFPSVMLESPGSPGSGFGSGALVGWSLWAGCPAWGGIWKGSYFVFQAGQVVVCSRELFGCWNDWPRVVMELPSLVRLE